MRELAFLQDAVAVDVGSGLELVHDAVHLRVGRARAEHGSEGGSEVRVVHHAVAVDVVGPNPALALSAYEPDGASTAHAFVQSVTSSAPSPRALNEAKMRAARTLPRASGWFARSRALSASQSVTFSARYLRMHWRNDATIAVRSAAETKAPASSASEEPATRRSEESTH